MKTSKKMQAVVTRLADKHGLDLTATEAYLRLDMPGFDRLVIERAGINQVRVAHYFDQQGNLIPDPEIIFFTGNSDWVPIKITQVIGGHRVYAVPTPDGQSVIMTNPNRQADLASFVEMWAKNIKIQGWLEEGVKWDPCDPSDYEQPSLETLMEWEAEGGCEAIDGCWVEPDGRCSHGCPSWLIVLGLI